VSLSDFRREFPGGKLPALYATPVVITTAAAPTADHDGDGHQDATKDRPKRRSALGLRNELFRNRTEVGSIRLNFPPDFAVTLSSSNSFSEHRKTVPLDTYLNEIMAGNGGETPLVALSNESWYLFGETYGAGKRSCAC
jgi:hypothetical protein